MTVLALRALGLGDTLTGVAALRGVRRAWPGHRLVLAAPGPLGAWLASAGVVDDVLPSRGLEPLGWDAASHVAVDLHGRGPESHRVLLKTAPRQLVAFDCAEVGHDGPPWRPDEHEVHRWCRLVRDAGGECGPEDLRVGPPDPAGGRGPHVVVHPGAASGSRRWPCERWAAVAGALARRGLPVVVTGSDAERDLCARVVAGVRHDGERHAGGPAGEVSDVAGRLDLHGLAEVVSTARLVVCGDTGVAHVATAFGTPSVVLFGPTPPASWGPAIDLDRHVVLWRGAPGYHGDPHARALDPALAAITVDDVLAATDALLVG